MADASSFSSCTPKDAADEIERLRADNLRLYTLGKKWMQGRSATRKKIERLRAALEPFADAATFFLEFYEGRAKPDHPMSVAFQTLLDARAALAQEKQG